MKAHAGAACFCQTEPNRLITGVKKAENDAAFTDIL